MWYQRSFNNYQVQSLLLPWDFSGRIFTKFNLNKWTDLTEYLGSRPERDELGTGLDLALVLLTRLKEQSTRYGNNSYLLYSLFGDEKLMIFTLEKSNIVLNGHNSTC